MGSSKAGRPAWQKLVTVILVIAVAIHSIVFFCFHLFLRTPEISAGPVFIGNAKPYYFDGSTFEDKEYKFESVFYKDLWLKADGVSEVVTTQEVEGADIDIFESEFIQFVTIDGQTIYLFKRDYSPSERQLLERAVNQVSALMWEQIKQTALTSGITWVVLLAALLGWCSYLRRWERKHLPVQRETRFSGPSHVP